MAYYIRIRKLDPVTSTVVQQVGNITINGNQAGTVLGVPGSGLNRSKWRSSSITHIMDNM